MLLTGPLEPTNQWHAVAKIAGIKLIEALRQQHGADFVSVMPTNLYGPGDNYHPEHSHVPAAAQLVADVVGYRGRFIFDTSRPDGAPQKLLNVSELTRLGWQAKTNVTGRHCGSVLSFSRQRRRPKPGSASRQRKTAKTDTVGSSAS